MKFSQQYKVQNEYLNDANDKLMQANRILRGYLKEVNGYYQELIIVAKEALKRNKNAQSQIEDLTRENEELSNKVKVLEAERVRLLKRSQVLDGITILAKETRQI